jgi:hypothetical protein
MAAEFWKHSNTVEECYEFMLAYAAQGHSKEETDQPGRQIREFLQRAAKAIALLTQECSAAVQEQALEPVDKYQAFFAVLDRDRQNSLAAIELVLAQPSISSQLVDDLNASIHLRALLTDLFLVGEILRSRLISG